jgi:glycosyltransferase A (GT-A) superfamily protein (DUF2064 family)
VSTSSVGRLVVVLAVPPGDPAPRSGLSTDRLATALLADAVDSAESLAAAEIAVLCRPGQAASIAESAAVDTIVWSSAVPTVAEAAARATAYGAEQLVVIASDAPHLPGLLVGKLFRPLGRAEVSISPDPRGVAVAIGLRLPTPEWLGDVDLDAPAVVDTVVGRAPRRAMVRTTPGWRRLREPADFAALDAAVEGADLTRAVLHAGS